MLLSDSSRVEIERVTYENLDKLVEVYNFEVEDWHTYHVGSFGVLVHNECVRPKSGGIKNSDGTTTYTKNINGKKISVTYSEGKYANFSPYAKKLPNGQSSVNIKYTGSRSGDFRAADRAAGYTSANPRPIGFTWHHVEDMKTMILVDSKIHNVNLGGFPHAGGIDVFQKLTGIIYKK